MKSPRKLHALVITIYVLCFPAAFFIGETFGKGDRFGSKMGTILPMLIGLFCLAPFVFTYGWLQRGAPGLARTMLILHAALAALVLIPGWGTAAFLAFPLFIFAMYRRQRAEVAAYFAWWDAQGFSPVPNPPGAILEKLDRGNRWTAHSGTMALADGRAVPFLFWEGSTSPGTTAAGSVRVSTQRWLFAFSFSVEQAGEGFVRAIETLHSERQDPRVKLRGAYDDRFPYLTARLPDGHFVAAWTIERTAPLVGARMKALRELLESNPPPAP